MKYRINSLFLLLLLGQSPQGWSDNLTALAYEGTLISLACMVDEDTPMSVDLGVVEDKRLYQHENSAAKPFSLTLRDCDPLLANSVSITLETLPGGKTADGYLLLDSGSDAKGAVIGIDNGQTRERIMLGSPLPKQSISVGTMQIPLLAYLRITPEALANQSLKPGAFTATLYYQVNFE